MAKNRIEFWLKDRDNVYLQLPVNPSEIDYNSPFGLQTVSIASLGDVTVPGERGVKQISFSSFFPRDYNPSYCEYEGFMAPWSWVEQIEKWRDTRKNIRIIISGTPISIPVFVSEFSLQPEKAGHPGDVYYNITLMEYRPIKAKLLQSTAKAPSSERPASSKTASKNYTVVRGDSLWKIAKAHYGDGAQFPKIYNANKSTIGKNPDLIYPGQKLVIP